MTMKFGFGYSITFEQAMMGTVAAFIIRRHGREVFHMVF